MMATLDGALSKDTWLAGDRFTGADLYIASALRYGMLFGPFPRRAFSSTTSPAARTAPPSAVTAEIDERFVARGGEASGELAR